MRGTRGLRLGVAAGTLALAAMALGGPAASGKVDPDATFKIKLTPRGAFFKGPKTIVPGGVLQVVNKTDPNAGGPHSFSLVKKSELPTTEAQRGKCGDGNDRKLICKDIAEAHDIVNRHANVPVVDNGDSNAWDTPFDGDNPGDSWYTETQNETHARTVPDSGKLYFLCINYPRMQASVKITAP